MHCVGEIDITRPRWSERPSALLPMILSNIENFGPDGAALRFEQGRQEAAEKEQDLLERLGALLDGERKAFETKRMIDRRSGVHRLPGVPQVLHGQSLLRTSRRCLVQAGVLGEQEDIFFLTPQELADVVGTNRVDVELIRRRKNEFETHRALTPPRVLTSEGEAISGACRRDDVPHGALVGLAVSAGTVEGRARVILEMPEADLASVDVLVTAHTDPSWSPLFVAVTGLVTEVGGLMTHGAVFAREYGLPAVVGVEHATWLVRTASGSAYTERRGYVEILP